MSEFAVVAQELGKDYFDASGREVRACHDLNFSAKFGEIFGLLGTNGAGKTTTLRMLSTVLRPTHGDAFIAGRSISREPEIVRSRIGFLSAGTGVYGRLSAWEMLLYFGNLHGIPADNLEVRAREAVEMLDMNSFLHRRCDKLSSGQKQRVSIARTVLHDPDVLIFDEPTTGLDILASSQIVTFIRMSRDRGKCVILSTHIMHEAERLCDRILIMHEGKVCDSGSLAELKERHGSSDLEDIFLKAIGHTPLWKSD